MKTIHPFRLASRFLLVGLLATSVSCMTTYDRAGRPVQSVDPGIAAVGVAAAGVIGYALANDNDHRHHHHYRHAPRPRYHRGYHCR